MIDSPNNRLAACREAAGKSRRDLAVALDVTEDTVRRLEKPETEIPIRYVPTLAALLGVQPGYLVGWESEPVTASGKAA